MTGASVLYEIKNNIAFITLNRPEKLNAFNLDMSFALRDAWQRFEKDSEARVAILSGNGTSFSAGVDLTDQDRKDAKPWQYHEAYPLNGTALFKPIVGAVRGYALGQGYLIAVTGCDITIASDNAIFGYPESKAGVSQVPPQYVPYMPYKIALEFMLLSWKGGRMMDAKRACHFGLVNDVVPDADLMNEAVKWAEMLKDVPPLFIKSVKYGYYTGTERLSRRVEREFVDFVVPQDLSEDKQEALRAFREKRDPRFKGK
ncbi:MAG: enoyl-CoA hydratase/isomerase family protein [Deltaproteobacteria bacterium]|nr:enoyl-CoA hydratase/isomerase family protein [Deltaproteobacteria bacterium]